MASLKDMRDRIGSVKATQKITKAMQMVAAAKLRRAQDAATGARRWVKRYDGAGGGSVRGYGFQRLGPFEPVSSLVPDDEGNVDRGDLDPIGGRSLNEFALEARYRFGDYGIVPFIDAGNSYSSTLPRFSDLRFGAGIGGRVYTNFGPLRVDVATPLNPRPGDGKVALYISIGQAF